MLPLPAIVCLLALAAGSSADGRPATLVEVAADWLEVFDEASDAAFSTGRVRRGDRLEPLGEEEDGWLAIAPPSGSLSWIEREAIEPTGDGRARVIAPAAVRPGAEGAKLPGMPRVTLRRGAVVQLLERPPLRARRDGRAVELAAIVPPALEVRYVRAGGVRQIGESSPADPPEVADRPRQDDLPPPVRRVARADELSPTRTMIDPGFAAVGAIVDESTLSPALRSALTTLEAEHRTRLLDPIERWDLTPIDRRYRELMTEHTDAAAQAALKARLDRVARQRSAAGAAARVEERLGRGRALAAELNDIRGRLERVATPGGRPYIARGLLQISSKQVDGERVFALIGESGDTAAYLRVPPGLPTDRLLTRRVGVRGSARYDGTLRSTVIRVQDLEAIGDLAEPETRIR